MKKFFVTLVACMALCNTASAINPTEAYLLVHSGLAEIKYPERQLEYFKNLPYEVVKQYAIAVADKAYAITNNYAWEMANTVLSDVNFGNTQLDTCRNYMWCCAERLNEQDLDMIDTRFAELFKGKRLIWETNVHLFLSEYAYFPKTCNALIEEYGVSPFVVNIYKNKPRHGEAVSLNYMAARVNYVIGSQSENFGELKFWLREFTVKAARMRLRSRSEGFMIRRDGSNPLKEVLEQVAACVNEPHQKGLKEFIEEYAPGYKWVDVKYPSDMDVMVLVGDILNGKEAIDGKRGILFFSLGEQQYNEFIDRYNDRNEK